MLTGLTGLTLDISGSSEPRRELSLTGLTGLTLDISGSDEPREDLSLTGLNRSLLLGFQPIISLLAKKP